MADGSFLMERYYGSDEESELNVSTLSKSNGEQVSPHKKDRNKVPRSSFQKNIDNEQQYESLPESLENQTLLTKKDSAEGTKKKKRKSKASDYSVLNIDVYSDELNDSSLKSNSSDSIKRRKKTKVSNPSCLNENYGAEKLNGSQLPENHDLAKTGISEQNIENQSTRKVKYKISFIGNTKKENSVDRENEFPHQENKDSMEKEEKIEECKAILEKHYFGIIGQNQNKVIEKTKSSLPKWLREPEIININLEDKEIPIENLEILEEFSKINLASSEIKYLFPVQLAVIPQLIVDDYTRLRVRQPDLCVSAPTGSGKTLAYVIPIVQALKERVVNNIRALVVLPISELANQVFKVFKAFVKNTDLQVVLLTGQKSFSAEKAALLKPGYNKVITLADIVVTTPGRILDHIRRTEGLTLAFLEYLVIDEADRMMEDIQKGWLKEIENAFCKDSESNLNFSPLFYGRPQSPQRFASSFQKYNHSFQKILLSATLSYDPEKLHSLCLHKPKLFITKENLNSEDWIGKCPLPENLMLQQIICNTKLKPLVLCHFLKKYQFKKILCFTESVERANRLQLILEEMGFQSREISSNYRPVQRKIILEQFNSGKIHIIVCSDIVARGIDIDGVDCVVSYDVPPFLKTFIHRVGRTARAGKKGTAIALVSNDEFSRFKKMLSEASMTLPTDITIKAEDLKQYEESFQNALKAADMTLRKQKHKIRQRNTSKKMK